MDQRPLTAQEFLDAAKHFGAFGFFVGILMGLIYGVGGFFVDLFTTGLNGGTWLAMFAIPAVPFLFLPMGVVAGILYVPLYRRIPPRFGGNAPESDS